jgi:hypothetical protein
MTVKITKPEINVREKISELDKPSGVAGEAMLRAETVAEQRALIGAGRRNLVMNGGFDVWQRGTTVTPASNTYQNFTADRWSAYFGGTYTQEQTTLPNGDYVDYFKGVLGTTGGNRININNFIENGNRIISGKYVTISFWLKASVIDSQVNVKIQTTNGSTFSSYTAIANKYIETSLDWKKYEITLKCNNDIANIGARPHALLEIDGVDGSWANGTSFEIAQVQLELGRVATPFEHRSYGEELALCQRYYHTLRSGIFGVGTTTGTVAFTYSSPVTMRATPTIAFKDSNDDIRVGDMVAQGHTINTCTIGTTNYSSAESQSWSVSGTPSAPQSGNLTLYRSYLLEPQQSNHGTFTFSAEL